MCLVPVHGDKFLVATDMTDGAVAAFEAETSNPLTPQAGICEWTDFFLPGAEPRRAADQWEALVKGHAELGMRDLQWAIGRSTREEQR